MSDHEPEAGWVHIGALGRAHGIKGGVRVWLDNAQSELLVPGLVLRVQLPKGPPQDRTIAEVYAGGGAIYLEGLTDRSTAETLKGAQLYAQRDDFPELDDDENYLVDLIGAQVVHISGTHLGTVRGFDDNGAQPLAEVEGPDGEIRQMPFVAGIVTDVDEDAGTITVDPPEGLLVGEAESAAPPGGGETT